MYRLYGYGLYVLYPTDMSPYLLETGVDSVYYVSSLFNSISLDTTRYAGGDVRPMWASHLIALNIFWLGIFLTLVLHRSFKLINLKVLLVF